MLGYVSNHNRPLAYRYGFGGQEKDDEIYGEGNSYTASFWQYDARLGRRWNVDPVVKHYESPYAALANTPIWVIDPTGADSTKVGGAWFWRVEKGDTYSGISSSTGVSVSDLMGINSQEATKLKIGSLVSLSAAKTPQAQEGNSSSGNGAGAISGSGPSLSGDNAFMATIGLTGATVESLGGLDKTMELLNSGQFKGSYNGETKIWSLKFSGNQHVSAVAVQEAKVANYVSAFRANTALQVVKGGGVVLNVIGTASAAHQMYNEINTNGAPTVETSLDLTFSIIGFGGLPGAAISTGYFGGKYIGTQAVNGSRAVNASFDNYGVSGGLHDLIDY